VRAKVKLVPAKERITDLALRYNDIQTFHEDMRTLVYRGELDIVFGFAKQDASGWFYEINVASYYTAPESPDVTHMLRDLSYVPWCSIPRTS